MSKRAGTYIRKIISGGQTGVDMGGLIAARELGIESGGIAPNGWLTENGPQEALLRGLGLTECELRGYPARTRRNIEVSNGTLLVGPYWSGGSKLTYEIAAELNRPLFHAAYSTPDLQHDRQRIDEFRYWLERYEIGTLNVAGNRESESPGISEFTRTFLLDALRANTSYG
jgi:hypothetical protein